MNQFRAYTFRLYSELRFHYIRPIVSFQNLSRLRRDCILLKAALVVDVVIHEFSTGCISSTGVNGGSPVPPHTIISGLTGCCVHGSAVGALAEAC